MFHVPITTTEDTSRRIEFCHIDDPAAHPGTWKKGKYISLDNVKINVFVGGDFSVVSESSRFSPAFGDFCVFPPHGLHYGSIPSPTHLDYYQLDIGLSAFDGIPNGAELLIQLCSLSAERGALVRSGTAELVRICENIEAAIADNNLILAFAYTVEAVDKMKKCYLSSASPSADFLTPMVKKTIEYVSENYASQIKIDKLAEIFGVSPSYLSRRFKKEVGDSVHSYLINRRITESIKLLENASIAEVAQAVGFCDSSHFISSFKRAVGCTPTEYVKTHFRREI